MRQEEGTHVGELADSVGLHSDVVLLQLLLDLINALGDVLGLGRDSSVKCKNPCGLAAVSRCSWGGRQTIPASLDEETWRLSFPSLCSMGTYLN